VASLATGLTIFTFGLAKKVLLADQFALYANPVFDAARDGVDPGFVSAWAGVLAYALQLYFDFSGYSDMAIGLSRIFNVKLPLNFNSPYKAESIIDFWRRWHMTLSAFLRDYLYFSLGGNRKGPVRRYANLLLTMILGGMWHGAGWGFLLWGTLHGLYLVGNHALRAIAARHPKIDVLLPRPLRILATFLFVLLAWVAFRATSLSAAGRIWQAMAGGTTRYFREAGAEVFVLPVHSLTLMLWIGAGLFIVWALPNTQQLLARQSPACDPVEPTVVAWPFSGRAGLAVGALFGACILMLTRSSEFLYFQF
jgi:D-alanyl-lipoteichoic acid acyltransferase DltB (MBOAT superfamily)